MGAIENREAIRQQAIKNNDRPRIPKSGRKKPANSSEFAKRLSEAPKKLKSLLPPNKNVTKIDPASRKLSMTNVRRSTMSQKNRMIEEMNDYLLKRKNIKGVKKQKTKK
jgi:hypothetical protein